MKKIYLLAGLLSIGVGASAQIQSTSLSVENSKTTLVPNKKKLSVAPTKFEGQVYYTNNFSTSTDWMHVSGPGQSPGTSGQWAVVNAVPASLVAQAPSYGFPIAMNSVSGGNFAFINSDEAGAGLVQDAFLINTAAIDLSAAGNASLYLNYTEIYRHYQESFSVEVSNNNGSTWTTFVVNPLVEVPVNTNSADPEFETVNISSAKGAGPWTNQVFVRFHYQGTYDWFWGIDDVNITEAFANEIKLSNYYQATDLTTTQGYDYYYVDNSQVSFPGLTFGGTIFNNGSATQNDVALHVTATGYDQTSSTVVIAQGQSDTLSISTPFIPGAVGPYVVNVETTMAAVDSVPTNNMKTFTMYKSLYEYGRDNNIRESSIGNVTSNPSGELSIGNIMEIFDPMTVTAIKIRLDAQAANALGSEFQGEIWVFDGTDFIKVAETVLGTVNVATAEWRQLKISTGSFLLNAGDLVLVTAKHFGTADPVRFSLAQTTYEQSVQGFIADGSGFSLSNPGAVMVRLSDDPTASVNTVTELTNVSVYPNPTTGLITISNNDNTNNTITITDITGKVVATKTANTATTIDLSVFGQGVYVVKVNNANGQLVERVVVR